MTFRLRWASAAHVCPQAGAKTLLCSPRSPHPWRKASRKLKLKARLHLLCPCRVCVCPPAPTGRSLGSAKVSRAQTFPSYPSEQGEEHPQSLSLASSYTFSYGSGLVQWQPGAAGRERQSSLEPAARAGEPLAPSAPTICCENWCQPAPAGSPPPRKPGEAASPKQRLSLYLFILPFLLSICSERKGGRGAGGGGGRVRVVRKWWKRAKLCRCEGFCMTGEGPLWGSIATVRSTSGPSYPPPPAGRSIFTRNVFMSLPQPADSRWSRWNAADSRRSVGAAGVAFRSKRVRSLP